MNREEYELEELYAHLAHKRERLSSPWLKADRADELIDLIREHSSCLPADLYEIGFNTPEHISFPPGSNSGLDYSYWPKKQIPEYFALLIGEAVHNLRSALDYVYVGMIRDKVSAVDSTKFQFPFNKGDRKKVVDVMNRKEYKPVHSALPNLKEFILDEIKPYVGGNETLRSVSVLSNLDKHNLIIPAIATAKIPIHAIQHQPRRVEITGHLGGGDANDPCVIFPGGPYTVKDNIHVSAEVRFSQVEIVGGLLVHPTLVQISQEVRETIEAFDKFVSGA